MPHLSVSIRSRSGKGKHGARSHNECMSIAEIAVRILFLTAAFFQNTRPAFEVASIRPSLNAPQQAVAAAGSTSGTQFRIAGLTIRDYISTAYSVKLNLWAQVEYDVVRSVHSSQVHHGRPPVAD